MKHNNYVLHEVSSDNVTTPDCLKKEILRQLGPDVASPKLNFPVGYIKSTNKLWIKSGSDIKDVWSYVKRGDSISLWCNGCRGLTVSSESEEDERCSRLSKPKPKKKGRVSALDEKNERVEKIVTELRAKHGNQYTSIQYRLWAEMVDVGTHKSLNDHPNVPIFTGTRPKKTSQVEMLSSAVSEMAKAMSGSSTLNSPGNAQAHTPVPASPSVGISPGKTASLRSNYLQQIRDLHTSWKVVHSLMQNFLSRREPF